uniref:C-type lysozyme inhibitor domain-containing protein n=1 Tax=Polynucleobacter necessarius subsp. necessarius (strain STIR1) TaxID=452638 RepID=B1XV64_POLNS
MKKNLLAISVVLVSLLGAATASANEEVVTWTCQESKQFKTVGSTEKVRLTWESKSYDLERQTSLPGSLRYKNTNSGYDLVVLGSKAMLFNIKAGVRLADFCQTAEMKSGKLPHLFAGAEPFVQN